MNKTQLVDALAARLGDRRTAASAVDGVLDIIVDTVGSGGSVTLTGFGVFEARARAARVARNPRTGETVPVPPTTVPAFRPGTAFKTTVAGNDGAAATAKKAPARNPRPATRATRAARSSGSFAAEEAVEAPAPKKTARSTAAKTTATKAAGKPAAAKKAKEPVVKAVKDKPAKKTKAKK
ncbi:HU family DNA-binding protein [Pseudonocardia sp. RS11V-5]|uniref:HU family DNA-binding protein n=1 Tax=Pseudonocardia terrae TaxID=2905831 RepID=UPI001E4B8621|nr:HU family DNA-binding protein [Pseudonocardia terrae]MCE3555758.1 HU family DNA-binding protein [Pseudonocardia terrae]